MYVAYIRARAKMLSLRRANFGLPGKWILQLEIGLGFGVLSKGNTGSISGDLP